MILQLMKIWVLLNKIMNELLSKIISLSKRKGFVFPSSSIYGGLAGFYDYGPLGVELKNILRMLGGKKLFRREKM